MTRTRVTVRFVLRSVLAAGFIALASANGVALGAAPAAESNDISPAERMIFMADHLHGIAQQTELDYALLSADQSARSADTVRVLVTSPGNAKGDAEVSDSSGMVRLPNSGLACNPVVIYFLERDIAEMERLTGGPRRYFQQRVRLALAANPKIETVTSEVNGKTVKAQQIVIRPYVNDPNARRFAQFTGKRYTFLIAADVPGQIASIRTDVPGANDDFTHPLLTHTLQFQTVVHKLASPPDSPHRPNPPNQPPVPAKPANGPRASVP